MDAAPPRWCLSPASDRTRRQPHFSPPVQRLWREDGVRGTVAVVHGPAVNRVLLLKFV